MSKGKKMNKEKAGGRGVQMKVFTFRKKTTPETQPNKLEACESESSSHLSH